MLNIAFIGICKIYFYKKSNRINLINVYKKKAIHVKPFKDNLKVRLLWRIKELTIL